MALLKRVAPLAGPLLMGYLFFRYLRPGELLAVFGGASLPLLSLSLGLSALLMLGKIHRLQTLLGREGARVRFLPLARGYAVANLVGQFSNLLVSDLVNAASLMADGRRKGAVAAVFLFNRACDLASILLLALVLAAGQGRLWGLFGVERGKVLVAAGVAALAALFWALLRERVARGARGVLLLASRNWGTALVYAFFIYLCYALGALCEARALGMGVSWGYLLITFLLGSLVTVAPVSVAGIGTRDLLFVFLLRLAGATPEAAVALSSLGFLLLPSLSLCLIYLVSVLGERYEAMLHR